MPTTREKLKNIEQLVEQYEYQLALEEVNQILALEPLNRDAKKWKDICEFMLKPTKIYYPETLLSTTKRKRLGNIFSVSSEGIVLGKLPSRYEDLQKKLRSAKTPWDEKRTEHEIAELVEQMQSKYFTSLEKSAEDEINKIIQSAGRKAKGKKDKSGVLKETISNLRNVTYPHTYVNEIIDNMHSPPKDILDKIVQLLNAEKLIKKNLESVNRKAKRLLDKLKKAKMINDGVIRSLKFELDLLQRKFADEWVPTYGEMNKKWDIEISNIIKFKKAEGKAKVRHKIGAAKNDDD